MSDLKDIDLNAMSLEDLESLRKQLDHTIKATETHNRNEAIAKLQSVAEEHGFTLSKLLADVGFNRGDKAPARKIKRKTRISKVDFQAKRIPGYVYVNPDNAQEIFTGQGRRPNWLIDKIEAGYSLEDLLVAQ